MEVHSGRANSVMAKRMWNVLRVVLYMIRKGGVVWKRKLMVDMNLMMMKRGRVLRKSLGNLMFHHHHHHHSSKHATSAANNYYYTSSGGFGMNNHYEYSCTNTPNSVLFHISKRKHHYFPCINAPTTCDADEKLVVEDQYYSKKAVVVVPRIQYSSPSYDHDYSSFRFATPDLAPVEKSSPLLKSPFSAVRISNYSSEDDEIDDDDDDVKNYRAQQVDEDAEEFIRKFYEQLRVQWHT
ncbi:hypothetical protein Scep_020842 [Stephania cephalantha]|uniref:Uncharacterized protein n=1 Tax=Stephania cephalantha TaxID=152367 RepID=A0AAP0F7F3_9MAGN